MAFDDCASSGSFDSPPFERRSPVAPAALHAALYPDAREECESDELEILSVNLTTHGVGMDLCRDVPVGTIYNISIGLGKDSLHSHVRITSCQPVAEGIYRAGGEFC